MKENIGTIPILALLIVLSLVLSGFPTVFADENPSFSIIREREVPEDFQLSVSTASVADRRFFDQAVAQNDGVAAVCSRFNESIQDAFSRVYIDIYDQSGSFWKEISFSTQFDVTIALENDSLQVYFYDYVIMISLVTEKLTCYEIEPNWVRESGLYGDLHQSQFSCGEWKYRCQKSIMGYTELVRFNDKCEQVLVSYSGMEEPILKTVFCVISLCLPILIAYRLRKKKYRE